MNKELTKFIKMGAIFLILIICMIFIFSVFYNKTILTKKVYYRQEMEYESLKYNLSKTGVDYAFFGDSHVTDDVDTYVIPNSYNFGSTGESYVQSYYRLKRTVEDHNIKIKSVVFVLDLHTFSSRLTQDDRLFPKLEIFSKFVSYRTIAKITQKSYLRVYLASNFPFFGQGSDILQYYVRLPSLLEIHKGYIKRFSSGISPESDAELKYNTWYKNQSRISNLSMEYFIKSIKFAEENNITVVYVRYPQSKIYDNMIKEKNISDKEYYDDVFNIINNVSAKKYYFFNYYNVYFENQSYFADSDHLNNVGAEIFSKQLYSDMKKSGINK